MDRPVVVYWNSQPTPYMVDRWNAVARAGNIDFRAWFNYPKEMDNPVAKRSWGVDESSWEFQGRYIKPKMFRGKKLYLPIAELQADRPQLVVQEYATPSAVLGYFVTRSRAPRVAFRFLPTHESWFGRSRAKEAMKHFLFSSVDAIKTAGADGLAALDQYPIPLDRRFAVTQSVDVRHFSKARQISPERRQELRQVLGLKGCVFIYVGRIWERKGLDYLLNAYRELSHVEAESSLLIVGDGIDEDRYRGESSALPNVVFTGFVQKEDLPLYYGLSDVFVFPTLGDPHGLVIDEALAAGLPVITTDAAGDVAERVPHGRAGFIVPPANAHTLRERMQTLADSPTLRLQMAETAVDLAATRSPEYYAEDFERFVFDVLEMPARKSLSSLITRTLGKPLTSALGA